MSWKAVDRITPAVEADAEPLLTEAIKDKIRSFFPRYETRRAVLLPALHIVQHALGHISHQAMVEVAALLDLHPAEVLDVVSFYTHFSPSPTGRKTIVVCRSLSCELMGGRRLLDTLKEHLDVEEHGTSPDGEYTLVTEECLAACDFAPCLLIGERMHKNVCAADLPGILADPDNHRPQVPRSDLFDPPQHAAGGVSPGAGPAAKVKHQQEAD